MCGNQKSFDIKQFRGFGHKLGFKPWTKNFSKIHTIKVV